MSNHHFISYSSVDAQEFALRLTDALAAGPPAIPIWLDTRELRPGQDWDEQLAEAIRTCDSLLFVMTSDSVKANSVCKKEWTRALKYKKPIIPLLFHPDAEMPFSLEPRQYIDFTSAFEPALAGLRTHLQWLTSPAGMLYALKERLADAERDLPRATDPVQQARIQADIAQLKKDIADQQRVVADPQGAAKRVEESIARGLERERQPEKPVSGVAHSKFINPPPGVAPTYFQDRHVETQLIGTFLKDEAQRLLTVVGRGGIGKTAMVCRLLKALERGHLPDDGGPLSVDGIVYLSATGSRRITVPNLYADLSKLLPGEVAERLDALCKDPQASTEAKLQALLVEFLQGCTVLLLDNFEDVIDPETRNLRDAELDEALRALLSLPPHAVKVIITSRIAPRALALLRPELQSRLDLDEGLPSPFAENILKAMDMDGKVGLRDAPAELLAQARERTRGYPRALEALFAILSADRDTSLRDILNDTAKLLPENVLDALVGEAFSRLDAAAQQVMQALAVYGWPVTQAAVDYLLQPYLPGVNSAPVLNRLVNMQFVRKEGGYYYLHPVDRAYALARLPEGEESDRYLEDSPPFTQFALLHRGADYFRQARTPRESWKTIDDLAPQLTEFDLRCAGQDYDTAAVVLLEINYYLSLWSHYHLEAELHGWLQGKLSNPLLKQMSANNLFNSYISLGHYYQPIAYYEQVLIMAREPEDRRVALSNLGWCYNELGQTAQAIEYSEQALSIARELGNRFGEGAALNNLGWYYSKVGETNRAIETCEQALSIARELGNRFGEGIALSSLAGVLIDAGRNEEALQCARQSVNIGDELSAPSLGNWSNGFLAMAHLYADDLAAARKAAEVAQQYDEPENNQNVLALLGLIALRQEDRTSAREAFAAAVAQANAMLAHSPQIYNSLDSKGLGLCGLALCEGSHHVPAAIEGYRAARAINKDAGVVGRVLRLFDALALADTAGWLAGVRAAAGGE